MMRVNRRSWWMVGAIVAVGCCLLPVAGAQAQTVGIGPRTVFISGADSPIADPAAASNTRFNGGFIRLRTSRHVGLEASIDFRTTTNAAQTLRLRSTPIQASLLVYPFHLGIDPYLIGGIGWYKERLEAMGTGAADIAAVQTSKVGYHAGVGGELMLGRRASIFLDYRYTFINFGNQNTDASPVTTALAALSAFTSLPGLLSLGSNGTGLSHQGSMITAGFTLYF